MTSLPSVLGLLICVVAVAACTGGEADLPTGGEGSEPPRPASLIELEQRFGTGPESVETCMRSFGFEYYADQGVVAEELSPGFVAGEVVFAQAALDNARAEGYGLVSDLRDAAVSSGLLAAEEATRDLNEEYFVELSPEERRAYVEALDGANSEAGVGCRDLEKSGGTESYEEALTVDRFPELVERTMSSNAVEEAGQAWVSCVRAYGYDEIDSREDALDLAVQLIDERLPTVVFNSEGPDRAVSVGDVMLSADELDLLQSIEIGIAVADLECYLEEVMPEIEAAMRALNERLDLVDDTTIDRFFGDRLPSDG